MLDLGLASLNCPDEDDLTRQYDERVLGIDSETAAARAEKQSAAMNTVTDIQPLKQNDPRAADDSCALSGVYTPEFKNFLRHLDEESGIRTVFGNDTRDQ
ncbi:MAG: hypothetical protein MK102_01285 [Fuerstiella sp.]|nr:hypothetical protein [Fuerstiella sp.]